MTTSILTKSVERERRWCVVPAAGVGARMGGDKPKQYLVIDGLTILEHTLQPLLAHAEIDAVLVCVAPDDPIWPSLNIKTHSKLLVADGGPSRAQSVLNGLHALKDVASKDDWVLVHDAARPCLPGSAIDLLMTQLSDDSVGGILAIPAQDTLKRAVASGVSKGEVDSAPRIEYTLDRSTVWLAQTPQMFRYQLLLDCLTDALKQGAAVTDEASAMEWAGYAPKLVMGLARNIKVTTPDDLAFAEFLLSNK